MTLLSPFLLRLPDPLSWGDEIIWNALDPDDPVLRAPMSWSLIAVSGDVKPGLHSALVGRHLIFNSLDNAWKIATKVLATTSQATSRYVAMPSGLCQLGCTNSELGGYCGQTHTDLRLGIENRKKFLARIISDQKISPSRFEVVFFGAEPLMNFPWIEATLWDIKREFGPASRGGAWHASLITNGLGLSERRFNRLRELGDIQAEITLDGLADMHDRRRPLRSGQPSYKAIFSNIKRICLSESTSRLLTIRMNVDQRNHAEAIPLLDHLIGSGIVPPSGFYVAPIRNWGHKNSRSINEDRAAFGKLEIEVFRRLLQLGLEPGLLPKRKLQTCIAANKQPNVLAPDGFWYGCTEVPLQSDLQRTDGRRSWTDLDISSWYKAARAGEYPCGKCKLVHVCGGSCPKEWEEGSVPCPSYHENLTARLRLWYNKHHKSVRNLSL